MNFFNSMNKKTWVVFFTIRILLNTNYMEKNKNLKKLEQKYLRLFFNLMNRTLRI